MQARLPTTPITECKPTESGYFYAITLLSDDSYVSISTQTLDSPELFLIRIKNKKIIQTYTLDKEKFLSPYNEYSILPLPCARYIVIFSCSNDKEKDKKVLLFDLKSGEISSTLNTAISNSESKACPIVISANNQRLLVKDNAGHLQLWDIKDKQNPTLIATSKEVISGRIFYAFSDMTHFSEIYLIKPSGRFGRTSYETKCKLWNLEEKESCLELTSQYPNCMQAPYTYATITPSHEYLIAAKQIDFSYSITIFSIINPSNPTKISELKAPQYDTLELCVTPCSEYFIACYSFSYTKGKEIHLHNITNAQTPQLIEKRSCSENIVCLFFTSKYQLVINTKDTIELDSLKIAKEKYLTLKKDYLPNIMNQNNNLSSIILNYIYRPSFFKNKTTKTKNERCISLSVKSFSN